MPESLVTTHSPQEAQDLHSRWFCTKGCEWPDAGLTARACAAPLLRLGEAWCPSIDRGETQMPRGALTIQNLRDLLFSLVLHFPMTAVLQTVLNGTWLWMQSGQRAQDLSKPGTTGDPCHLGPEEPHGDPEQDPTKPLPPESTGTPGPWHLQASSPNQDTTGTSVLEQTPKEPGCVIH